MSYANNKGADQRAHPRSLISAFVVRCLDSVMSLVSVTKISSLMLASIAEQASLSLTGRKLPKTHFLVTRFLIIGIQHQRAVIVLDSFSSVTATGILTAVTNSSSVCLMFLGLLRNKH